MVRLASQSELRRVQELPFCYICGRSFLPADECNRDHIPPKSIFKGGDKLDSLWLPTHTKCNNSYSSDDEKIGQLLGVLHKRYPNPQHLRLDVRSYRASTSNLPVAIVRGLNLPPLIGRWVRAFHAALYNELLPSATNNFIHPPFPSGQEQHGKLVWDKILVQHPLFVEIIKKNRIAGRIDHISCYNHRCIYECVWEQTDADEWVCVFALNVYDWSKLGDRTSGPRRGCVGFYQPISGRPVSATTGVCRVLEIPEPSGNPLDAFDRFAV